MPDLPIIVYNSDSAHEAIREVTDKEFSAIAAPQKTVLMEIFQDRVFIYPLKTTKVLQQMFVLLISTILLPLALFSIIQWTDYLFFQGALLIGYLIFVAPKTSYHRVLVPTNFTNYYRNQLRDDPASKVRKISYEAVLVDWSGYHHVPQIRQIIQLSSKVGTRIQDNFKGIMQSNVNPSRPIPDFDDTAFLEEQKREADPYNLNQKPE